MNIKCKNCGALLMKATEVNCEVKCRSCNHTNIIKEGSLKAIWNEYLGGFDVQQVKIL